MHAYCKFMMRCGDKKGNPIIEPGEDVPGRDDLYSVNPHRVSQPRAVTPHGDVPFMRAHGVHGAVGKMRNMELGGYPVQVRPDAMPTGLLWNNFVPVRA